MFDEDAIKKASGNRNYSGSIDLPPLNKLEKVQEPKMLLHDILQKVSGKKSRNLKNFKVGEAVHLVGEYIGDYSPLRQLFAFQQFEKDLKETLNNYFMYKE